MYSLPGPSLLADVAHNLPNSPPISLAKPSHTCNLSLFLFPTAACLRPYLSPPALLGSPPLLSLAPPRLTGCCLPFF